MIYNMGQQSFGNRRFGNPFAGSIISEVQDQFFRDTPSAVYGDFLSGIRTTGPSAYGNNFRSFADQWAKSLYGEFEGGIGSGAVNPDLSFRDYLGSRTPDLNRQFAYASGIARPAVRTNRWLRRY